MADPLPTPKVFISYSHSPPDHADKRLAVLFDNLPAADFRGRIEAAAETTNAARWQFDYSSPAWSDWLNLEKLGTRP